MPSPISNSAAVCGTSCNAAHQHTTAAEQGLGIQTADFFKKLLDTSDWPPRWHCGKWSDFHGWLYIISDLLIWASYYIIPLLLITLVTRRKDIPFPKVIWLFVAFIISCGTTHLFDAIIFWWPAYRISAVLKFTTALISIAAVFALYKILPHLLNLRTVKELEREIAERKIAEQKLADNEAILHKSLDLLSRHNQQLKNFTHILSHNIRNHASNISLLTDMIDEDKLDEDNLEITQKIKTVSERLNATLDDLSTVIKIRETVLEPETLHFDSVTRKVLEVMQSDLDANQAVIDLNFEAETISFPGIYLESIIMNLISNSIKYRKPDVAPHIGIHTYTENNRKVLTCTDNGIGIDLQLHGEKVFGLYKTFHHHRNAHGVGLFLIKNQIESQGGTIAVTSKPNEGTTFKITFNEQN
ncbi:HAMP domain-containing histidine kinase [Mucilaginibacter sp. Bleaf8]|uniref:sensor histidine kinase n=1 Tax=Mucilaginibacter sp. Bleaf8 TaxID=2834430 RepID=UPI001BD0CCF2|nr:HAMP domain-containing sensor histidine kinase [Mucilaginibacter sp. Bleaf8]MBS7564033.1 HAMP domain-containing histidine kinase [Mucilaginibacter sp. Bleaf8]